MKFGERIRAIKNDLYVTPRYEAWLARNHNANYSPEAIKFATYEFSKVQRRREGTYSASSLGDCMRQQQFKYLGLQPEPLDGRTINIFHNGTFTHLRWQMAGISEGFIHAAEVPLPFNPWNLSGTMDALLENNSVLEVKSINSNGFRQVTAFGPQEKHKVQAAAYVGVTDAPSATFIYENKDTQEYREIIVLADDLPIRAMLARANTLWEATNARELLPILDSYWEKKAPCTWCPFAIQCATIKTWDEAEERSQ